MNTRRKLLEATKTTRNIIDILLEYLLRELNIRDLYALSSPTECKKYVLFMANMLSNKFIEFQIMPTKDKSGTIAFRSVKDLVEPPETEKRQRQSLCLTLAYFYVRIFQIYGAIALTLLDDASLTQETGAIQFVQQNMGKLQAPGLQPYHATGPLGIYTRGGATRPDNLGTFEIFRGALGDRAVYGIGYPFKTQNIKMSLRIDPIGYGDPRKRTGTIYVEIPGRGTRHFELGVVAASEEIFGQSIVLLFEKVKIAGKVYDIRDLRDSDGERIIHDLRYRFVRDSSGKFRYDKSNKAPISIVENVATLILKNVVSMADRDREGEGRSRGFDPLSRYSPTSRYSDVKQFEEKDGVDEHLKIGVLVNGLIKKRPFAHCIGRALQLLRTAPLGDESVESNICNTRFLETRASVPTPTLDKSIGISTAANLFYDMIDTATPKLIMSSPAVKEYTVFMKQMSSLFAHSATDSTKLRDISTETRDREICGSQSGPVMVSNVTARKVYPIVQAMFGIQLAHASRCAAILNQLFLIQRKPTGEFEIHISPTIFKKGIGELNRIGAETREVLVGYYTQCESNYLNGMKIIAEGALAKTR